MENLERDKSFPLYFLAQHALLLTAMVVKPSRLRWMFWLPIAAISFHLFYSTSALDPVLNGSVRCHVLIAFFIATDFILLTDVQNELRRIGHKQSISNAPIWARIKWALQLHYYGLRGVGWEHEPKSVLPPRPQTTRGRFVVSQLLWLVVQVLYIDAVQFTIRHTHCYEREAPSTLEWRFLRLLLFALASSGHLNILHTTSSIVFVATGVSQPSEWPPMFGRWRDAYTVRKFWGHTWHQMLRRVFSSHGKYLARRLGFHSGSNSSSYIQLYTAFFMSGVIHTFPTDNGPLYFFLSQAVAITFEDAVIAVAGRVGYKTPTKVHRLLGYAWVWCWFIYSIPLWTDSMLDQGMLQTDPGSGILDAILLRAGLNGQTTPHS